MNDMMNPSFPPSRLFSISPANGKCHIISHLAYALRAWDVRFGTPLIKSGDTRLAAIRGRIHLGLGTQPPLSFAVKSPISLIDGRAEDFECNHC